MKSFYIKALLFLVPFLVAIAVELFVLPMDFFCFRIWEALYILQVKDIPEGRFYPNMSMAKLEQGDLAPYSEYAVRKDVVWHTDAYGFRNDGPADGSYRYVIVGDSSVVGTANTQSNMLNEALERRLGRPVYAFAPFGMNKFVADSRFRAAPPDTVIFVVMERYLQILSHIKVPRTVRPDPVWKQFVKTNRSCQQILMLYDRFRKMSMLQYARGRVRARILEVMGWNSITHPRVGNHLYFEGASANLPVPKAAMDDVIKVLEEYRDYFKSLGIRFVFVPVPNKENVYFDEFPKRIKPMLLDYVIPVARRDGIETVDLQTPYRKARQRGKDLFHDDDSHWNPAGIDIAADEIASALSGPLPTR